MEATSSSESVHHAELNNLACYKAQLEAISQLIAENGEAEELLSARSDLEELIKITEEGVLATEKLKLMEKLDNMTSIDKAPALSGASEDANDIDFSEFTGSLCHTRLRSTRSGKIVRHAVMILGLEEDNDTSYPVNKKVRVLFVHPTESWMVPCEYFLQQRCFFNEKCKLSHGHLVDLKNILEYEEHDRSKLVPGSSCLANRKDPNISDKKNECNLWREAEVVSFMIDSVVVQFPGCSVSAPPVVDSLPLEDVMPLPNLEEDDDYIDDMQLSQAKDVTRLPEETATVEPESQNGASWEAHTRGIGSKLLAKMGWLGPGSGVGKNDQGCSEPIPVEVMPKGMSLDSFLHLRNEAGMVTLGKGAIKMLKSKASQALLRKEEKQQASIQEKTVSAEETFFSFLNDSVSVSKRKNSDDEPSPSKKSRPVAKADDKEIGVTLLQTAERIRHMEREIAKMQGSLARLQGSRISSQKQSESSEVERLRQKIADANKQLSNLRSQERKAMDHRSAERDKRKLTIF